ncbi:MAG TPA: DUF4157 domain-containing protein [Thermoanaerobaculia bacterium]|nr:DUF4157 domain-containing protein [Thermoanaerobaculia bacterium]
MEDAIADTRAKVCMSYPWWLRPWLMRDVVGITLGRRIYLNGKAAPATLERLLRHELVHVRQINRLGLFVFYWRYVSEFARHFWHVRSIGRAYALISFEREACAAECDEKQGL